MSTPRTHRIEVHPGHFRGIKAGARRHDVRTDSGFAEGHLILYLERDPGEDRLTGDEVLVVITAMTSSGAGLIRGFVALSLERVVRPTNVPGELAANRALLDARGAEKL